MPQALKRIAHFEEGRAGLSPLISHRNYYIEILICLCEWCHKKLLDRAGSPLAVFRCSPSHQLTVLRPSPASRLELRSYHDRSYIDALFADPPGPDPASCKEFGLEDVITALILSVALYALLDTGLCTVSRFQRIRSRNSWHDTDCGTRARRRQV